MKIIRPFMEVVKPTAADLALETKELPDVFAFGAPLVMSDRPAW